MEEGKLRSRLTIVLDGQYGSCGKGAYAQWLAAEEKPALALRTGGPNAGHSVITPRGVVALRHIPAACVECPETTLALDRKSTRLNSSHVTTSYALYCLK